MNPGIKGVDHHRENGSEENLQEDKVVVELGGDDLGKDVFVLYHVNFMGKEEKPKPGK